MPALTTFISENYYLYLICLKVCAILLDMAFQRLLLVSGNWLSLICTETSEEMVSLLSAVFRAETSPGLPNFYSFYVNSVALISCLELLARTASSEYN